MGGIGLSSTDLNRTPNTPVRTYIRNHTYIYLHTMHNNMHLHRIQNTHICSTSTIQIHTICTQNAHTQTHIYTCKHISVQKTKIHIYSTPGTAQNRTQAQHRTKKIHIYAAHNMHTICTHTEHRTQNTEYTSSTYDLHKYSLDYYNEFAYIKNSNTIELYTILK